MPWPFQGRRSGIMTGHSERDRAISFLSRGAMPCLRSQCRQPFQDSHHHPMCQHAPELAGLLHFLSFIHLFPVFLIIISNQIYYLLTDVKTRAQRRKCLVGLYSQQVRVPRDRPFPTTQAGLSHSLFLSKGLSPGPGHDRMPWKWRLCISTI